MPGLSCFDLETYPGSSQVPGLSCFDVWDISRQQSGCQDYLVLMSGTSPGSSQVQGLSCSDVKYISRQQSGNFSRFGLISL